MKPKVILIVIYIILGLLILNKDYPSAVLYFTVIPFHLILLKESRKINNLFLFLFMFFLLLSIGGSSITMYLTRFERSNTGTSNLGEFDFSLSSYYRIYSYLFILYVLIVLFTKKLTKNNTITPITSFIKEEIISFTRARGTYSVFPIILFSVIFALISIWMYQQHIGITGILSGKTLPFHMSGILYYARRFLFTGVLLFLFVKTRNKQIAFFVIVVYAFVAGVSAASKSISMMMLAPLALYFFFTNRKALGFLALFFTVFTYAYVAGARELIFSSDADASLSAVVQTANEISSLLFDDSTLLMPLVNSFFGSLFGFDNAIVAYQSSDLGTSDFIQYFSGREIGAVVPDLVYKLYNFNLPDDRAYGISLGFSGSMMMMAARHYFFIVIEALIVSLLLAFQNKNMYVIMKTNGKRVYKFVSLILLLVFFQSLIASDSMLTVYMMTFAMYVLKRLCVNRKTVTKSFVNEKVITG